MIWNNALVVTMVAGYAAAQCAVNSAASSLIQSYEKFAAKPYNDGYGYWTVGYGHRCIPNTSQCSDVKWPLTEAAAQQLFQKDMQQYETCLSSALKKCLNGNQYGALVSWAYNTGCGGMSTRTLIKEINAGQDPDTVAQAQLPKWNMAGGKVSPGLVSRRKAEVNLFDTANSDSGNCCTGGGSAPAPAPAPPSPSTGNSAPATGSNYDGNSNSEPGGTTGCSTGADATPSDGCDA